MEDPHPVVEAPVTVVAPPATGDSTVPPSTVVLSPKTTEEEDRLTLGQRRINLVWEATQSIVVLLVTATTLYVAAIIVLRGGQGDNVVAALLILSGSFNLVVQAYIVRTNHTKVGGVGKDQAGR